MVGEDRLYEGQSSPALLSIEHLQTGDGRDIDSDRGWRPTNGKARMEEGSLENANDEVRGVDNDGERYRHANQYVAQILSRIQTRSNDAQIEGRLVNREVMKPAWRLEDLFPRKREVQSRSASSINADEDSSRMMARDGNAFKGPNAHVQVPDLVDASVSIGMASMGGPESSGSVREPFSVFMPPPFRIIFLIALGLLCWSANLRGLRRMGLDADGLLASETKVRILPHHRHHGEQLVRTTAGINGAAALHQNHAHAGLVGTADSDLAVYFRHPGAQETAAFHFGLLFLTWGSICWVTYRLYAFKAIFFGGDQETGISNARGRHAQAIQGIAVLGVIAVAVWPGDVLHRGMRKSFGIALLRICKPSLHQRILFPDVVLADILTSYARVYGELWLTMCFLWPKSDTPAWWNGKGSTAVPLLVSLPYLIRFRQCLSEYNTLPPSPVNGKRHIKPLLNACKYASTFPVIWLSVLQSSKLMGDSNYLGANMFFYLWMLSVFFNSFYSFWWDVTNDWGLGLLKWRTWANTPSLVMHGIRTIHRRSDSSMPGYKTMRTPPSRTSPPAESGGGRSNHPSLAQPNGNTHGRFSSTSTATAQAAEEGGAASLGAPSSHHRHESMFLRSNEYEMLFPPIAYQCAVTCDLILRFAWSLKLSSHLHHVIELESTAFYLEALEILRRWGWTYLRIEWEACKRKMWEDDSSMESLTLASLRVRSETNNQHRD